MSGVPCGPDSTERRPSGSFCWATSQHRTRQAVWADVKRAAKAFRIRQNVAPHSFRKVYAVELLRRCGDVKRVQRALNHSDCATTMVYVMAAELLEAKRRARSKSS